MVPEELRRLASARFLNFLFVFLATAALALPLVATAEPPEEHQHVRLLPPVAGVVHNARKVTAEGTAVVNFNELSHHGAPPGLEVRALSAEEEVEEPLEPVSPLAPGPPESPTATQTPSPSPTSNFQGLDDIPMVDSLYIIIPPDVGGAVGLTKVMSGHNNNYRIFDKATGAALSTVGTATFWAPSGETDLNGLTDPRTTYDPYNNRWIAVMQTISTRDILIGVSQTSDPSGNWFLYRFATGVTIDYPILGFSKNWISVSINRYSPGGTFQRGINLVVDYGQARAGVGTGTIFTLPANTGFCASPCNTYSATEDTLFVLTHLASSGGTYTLDWITGTPSAPVYTVGGNVLTRPGGGWAQPGGQTLPQSAPNSGTSSCSPPCLIESQDAQIRSAPSYRGGYLYYAQTIGLPASGLTHTAVQWSKVVATTGAFVDGGRIDDATATATNGGKWYAYTHIATNSLGDFIVGYSQFSSAQHPSAGYSMHLAGDAAGTLRDPLIYKTGEDYYHKDFGSGRNRWGDFSQAQVDPSDDRTLWVLDEYAKARTGTNDGTTGANSSRWSTWWASVGTTAPLPVATLAPGPSLSEGNSGLTAFNFTVNLSAVSASPVTVNYQTSDGTATVADNDYQAASNSIVIPAGTPSGTITVNVVGDATVEPNETFHVTLTGATNATVGAPGVQDGTIVNDDNYVITASAGANGAIAPSGPVSVVPGDSQAFTITPNACHHVADVLVDGASVGAVTTYTFSSVSANHTIAASFALDTFAITATAGTNGTITPSGAVAVGCGADQSFTIAPGACQHLVDVVVDGSSVGAVTSFTFTNVTAAHTIAASFASDVSASIGDVTQYEGSSGTTAFNFPVRLSAPCASAPVGVTWKTVDGTALASDADFVPDSTVFSFAPGATTGTITVQVNGDTTPESQETFHVQLFPGSAGVADGDGLGTILNDEDISGAEEGASILEVSFAVRSANPAGDAVSFRLGLPAPARADVSVYDIAGRLVAHPFKGDMGAGYHDLTWNAHRGTAAVGSGVYFVRFSAQGKTFVRRFVLLR